MNAGSRNNGTNDLQDNIRPVGQTLLRASKELSDAARACTEIQWLVSTLLERAHHPDLPAELHMLQDIDRIQQTLDDLASLLEISAKPVQAVTMDVSEITERLKLESLRARILGTVPEENIVNKSSEITWL